MAVCRKLVARIGPLAEVRHGAGFGRKETFTSIRLLKLWVSAALLYWADAEQDSEDCHRKRRLNGIAYRSDALGFPNTLEERARPVARRIAKNLLRWPFFINGAIAQKAYL